MNAKCRDCALYLKKKKLPDLKVTHLPNQNESTRSSMILDDIKPYLREIFMVMSKLSMYGTVPATVYLKGSISYRVFSTVVKSRRLMTHRER